MVTNQTHDDPADKALYRAGHDAGYKKGVKAGRKKATEDTRRLTGFEHGYQEGYQRAVRDMTSHAAISGKALVVQMRRIVASRGAVSVSTETLQTDLEQTRLSPRTRNTLKRHSIDTIGDVIERSADELLELPVFGSTALREVKKILWEDFDLTLKHV